VAENLWQMQLVDTFFCGNVLGVDFLLRVFATQLMGSTAA